MNAPLLGSQFRVVCVPLTTVRGQRDLARDIHVAARPVASQRLSGPYFSHEKEGVWCITVAFDDENGGEFTAHFGCRAADMGVFRDALETGAPFTARVGTGLGPPAGGLDLEPRSVWYLTDLAPGARRQEKEPLYALVPAPGLMAS